MFSDEVFICTDKAVSSALMSLGRKASAKESVKKEEFKPSSSIGTLAEIEKEHILRTFAFYDRHRIKTAKALGISLSKLYRRLLVYGEEVKDEC